MKKLLKNIVVTILIWEAKQVLKKYQPTIIVVAGDVGKTTTKDAVYAALKNSKKARKSEKSLNSETGLPLSILGAQSGWSSPQAWFSIILKGFRLITKTQSYPELLILELGDRKPGDSKFLAEWIKPDIVILTHVDDIPTHVEFFDSIEGSRKEKQDILEAMKQDGVVIVNSDDANALTILEEAKRTDLEVVTYGESPADVTITGCNIASLSEGLGMEVAVDIQKHQISYAIPGYLGKGVVLASAAAIGAAGVLDVSLDEAIVSLGEEPDLPKGRLRAIPGVKRSIVIDDTYNAGFASTKLALETLKNTPGKRHIAVLADMLELGSHSAKAHKQIGEFTPAYCDMLVVVGEQARIIADAARSQMGAKKIFTFSNSREAGKFVEQMIEPGDVVLIKGSQGLRMERATQEVMLHPEQREKLLVRQEKEWLRR